MKRPAATYQFTVPRTKVAPRFEAEMCRVFGGFTANDAEGVWRNEYGAVERERVRVYQVTTDKGRHLQVAVARFLHALGERFYYFGKVGAHVVRPTIGRNGR